MIHITAAIAAPDLALAECALHVDRHTLAKRLWRGTADDGTEFGFELTAPLRHHETVHQAERRRYVIRQQPEPLLEVSLDLPSSAAAGIGWAVGNLHLELAAEPHRLLAPDELAVRRLFERLGVGFQSTSGVFRPGRFSRGALPTHELGRSHQH